MIQAVLFDFDGLILDTEYPEFLAWKDIGSVAVEDNKGFGFQVMVRVPGASKPWLSVPVVKFPSMEVFFALVDKFHAVHAANPPE